MALLRQDGAASGANLEEEDATLFHAAPNFASVPYGTRLKERKAYNIIRGEEGEEE